MKIIAGKWRGRTLTAPPGLATRPTASRTREALFSMLTSRLGTFEDLRVADLFAGSGALGFEALSRGAASATFVEGDAVAAATIKANAEKLQTPIELIRGSAFTLPHSDPFHLVFADPPYSKGSGTAVAQAVVTANWLPSGGWMSIETSARETIEITGLVIEAVRNVGRAKVTLLRRP